MPKRVKHNRRTPEAAATAGQISAYMAKLGAKGGKISGARRMKNLSGRQRRDIARRGAAARWTRKRSA